jgi:hypothetical protein
LALKQLHKRCYPLTHNQQQKLLMFWVRIPFLKNLTT